jgi:hypothetical protein
MTTLSAEQSVEDGHEQVYRLTATNGEGKPLETKYFLSPYEVRAWRDRLRETGYEARASVVPAAEFRALSDAELDALVEAEQTHIASS